MKKEEFKQFVGIDISKQTLDVALLNAEKSTVFESIQIANNASGMKELSKWIDRMNLKMRDLLFCMEFTGVYGVLVQKYLVQKKAFVWVEMPVQILRSIGLQRGKNDRVDAQRIATYAMRFQDQRVQWSLPSQAHQALNDLMKLRDRLLTARNMLTVPLKELKSMGEKQRAKLVEDNCARSLKGIEKELREIDAKIEALLKTDNELEKNINLITTIPGVGKRTALSLVLATNDFSLKMNSRQMASYCGCAPFTHQSGSSVRGKTRVSNMANKTLKKLLTLCATSLINKKNEMGEYYNRKVAEGKNKMSVINALRNKLIHRICAVIERQTPYITTMTTS